MDHGQHGDSVSRAYYAVFHAGCALLAHVGRRVHTHDGLRSAVGEHFVKTGHLPSRYARILAHVASDRADADYNVALDFAREEAEAALAQAREFVLAAEALLAGRPVPP